MVKALLAALLVSIVVMPAAAQGIAIEHPWARATAGQSKNGAAYMTLSNLGDAPERLVKAESPAAATVEIHTHVNDNGIMRMRPVNAIEVSPGEPSVLQPGGLHIMLIGLKEPLLVGAKFPLTLTFESGKSATVQVNIRPANATAAAGGLPPPPLRGGHSGHPTPAKPAP